MMMKGHNKTATNRGISAVIWANIRKFQNVENMPDEYLAGILRVSVRSLYNYDAEPFKVTLEKVQHFMNETGTRIEDLIH